MAAPATLSAAQKHGRVVSLSHSQAELELARGGTTLVLWSDENPGSGENVGQRLASLIPGAEFYCMADAGHCILNGHQFEHHHRVIARRDLKVRFMAGKTI